MTSTTLIQTLQEKLRDDSMKGVKHREDVADAARAKLRDMTVFLREPSHSNALAPANPAVPSMKIGDVPNFPFPTAQLPSTPGNGQLSKQGGDEFWSHMKDAAARQDPGSRDAATGRAAKAVAHDYAVQHGLMRHPGESVKASMLHEVRAQAAFASREIGAKLGVGPVQSSLIGYSLERALEKEGFKVLVSHAVDKTVDVFKATASSAANATGLRHSAESSLNKSMQWLASHGVTPEAFKGALTKHAGAITAVVTLSQNPEVVQRAAQIIAHSPKGLEMAVNLAKDDQLRKAVGTATLAAGETLAVVHKGVGSAAILAGAALRGDSVADTGRHAFRAAMSVLGGAAGGVAAGAVSAGFGSVAGAVAGSAAGSVLADKLIALYDRQFNNGVAQEGPRVDKQEVAQAREVLTERAQGAVQHAVEGKGREVLSQGADRAAGFEREMRFKHNG